MFVGPRLAGCALVEHQIPLWRKLLGLLRHLFLWFSLPRATLRCLNAYGAISQSGLPKGTTHFLVMIGIADGARGQGLGGAFIRQLERQAGDAAHWALDTENPRNVELYEHLGYILYDEVSLEQLHVYKMHKPAQTDKDLILNESCSAG